jgi:hypothetical protein
MIDYALDPLRREAIDVFAARDKLEKDALSETDRGYLRKIRDFLRYFEDATLSTEGHVGTLDRVLPTMDFLLASVWYSVKMSCRNRELEPNKGRGRKN